MKIADFIKEKGGNVEVINLESVKLDRESAYGCIQLFPIIYVLATFDEKNTHEVIKTQVSRLLRSDNFVILDTMNFIKGYRYEMYCIARGSRTSRCVVEGIGCINIQVWVDTPMSVIEKFNATANHFTSEVQDQ